jgi:hypothetical protein
MRSSAEIQPATVDAPSDRRGEQRFPLRLPMVIKRINGLSSEQTSLTHDVSARGAVFDLNQSAPEGTAIELVLTLPAEITLSEDIHVCCRTKVVRTIEPTNCSIHRVAVLIEKYDFTR